MTPHTSPQLTLASASARRHELLALIGLPFERVQPQVDESRGPGESPADFVRRLSREKAAQATAALKSPALILAADTIVVDGDDVLGKPHSAGEATAMLRRLGGREHRVYTAITLLPPAGGAPLTDLADSPVRMRPYTAAEIAAYVVSGDSFDKAGAYAIQHRGFHPVDGFAHCFANVMGLPLCHVTRCLIRLGVTPPADVPAACQAHLAYACPVHAAILSGEA
jgi:MAF protein